jgi:NAD-dependent DNA ligase
MYLIVSYGTRNLYLKLKRNYILLKVIGVFVLLAGFVLCTVNMFLGLFFIFLGGVFIQYGIGHGEPKTNSSVTDNVKNETASISVSTTTYSTYEGIEGFDEYEETEQKKLSDSKILDKVKFKYKEMERVVDVYSGKRGETFDGFCHKTGMVITFYFSRINDYEVVKISTGEVMTPMEWRYKLQGTKLAQQEIEKEKLKREREIISNERNRIANEKIKNDLDSWLSLTEPKPIVEFHSKVFALGGYFESGNIEECKEKVISRGGVIKKDPSAKVDYIVVNKKHGVNATYEKTIKRLIERGKCPLIISEEHWLESME